MSGLPTCSRGEIWMLNWEHPHKGGRGSEQGGHRPALIVQTDLGNHALGARTTVVVPLTSQGRPFVFYVPIPKAKDNGLPADSWANATQLFTVDMARLEKKLGKATIAQMAKVGEAVKATLDIRA